jgi:site-specific DNA recombinase
MKKKLAAIYTRVSSTQQKEEETIDSQVDVLINYANQNNFEVPCEWIFKDEGYSGSTLDRPGLDELRDLVRENALDIVLVYSPDRLARRYVNQLILEEEFFKYAVKLIYIKGSKNETPEDQLLKHFQGIFAEYERSQILDRSRRGKLYKARQGNKNILPKAPYGYNSCRQDFFSINNQQAIVVREIFGLYIKEGYSLRSIAKHLDKKDISSPSGSKKWSPTTIRAILCNTAYIGTAYYGKTEKGEGDPSRIARYSHLGKVVKAKNPKKDKPKEEWLPIIVPSIINESDFECAQDFLQKNKEFSRRNTKVPSILQGVLVCGVCSRSYYKKQYGKNGKKWCSYYCHSQIDKDIKWCGNPKLSQDQLDNIVWQKVIELIEHPKLIEEEIERRINENPKKKEIENREQEIEKEIKRIKRAQDKLLDAYQETECLEINELKARLQKLKVNEKDLKKELDSLHAISILNEKRANLQVTMEEFRLQLTENAKNMSIEKKQKIIRALIEEVIIMPGEITINHTISLNPDRSRPLRSVSGGKPRV